METAFRNFDLAWSPSVEDQRRLRRAFMHVAGVLAVLSILMPWLPVREPDPGAEPEVPPRIARLVTERRTPPPPPVVEPVPEPEPILEKRVEQKVEPPKAEPEPEPRRPREVIEPRPDPQAARKEAASSGVLAFADQLKALRSHSAVSELKSTRRLETAEPTAGKPERAIVTRDVTSDSGGIDTSGYSRDTGAPTLATRDVTRVESPVVAELGVEAGEGGAATGQRVAARSREEIERVFDQNKGAIHALYRRALRANPALQGKLVLKLTIAPSGKVTACEVVSSELDAPEFERKLVQRVKLFDFGAKDVAPVTTTKPIDFFPV